MNNFSLDKIKEFENFIKDNDYEFLKFSNYLELTEKGQDYEELFFKKYLGGYYKINQFLSLVEENNLTEKIKEYIFKFGELETVISYYLYLFAKKDNYQEEVKKYIIKQLDLKTYINYQFRFQLYLFTTLNNIDFGKYVYLLRENNHCSDNEINLINSKFDSLFCSSKEFSKYNDKTTILNINRKEIEKIKKTNNDLFIKNTLLFIRNLVTSSSDITYGSNISLLESYINFNEINLLNLLSEYGASGIISFYKDSSLQITKRTSILSIKHNEIMSIEEKFIFMEKICEYINKEIEVTEYIIKKIYLDLLFINEECGFNLADNNMYPEINNLMLNLFFHSMTKSDYFQGENKIYFTNNILNKNKNSNYNYGNNDEDKDEYKIEYVLYESEENIYKMQKNTYQNMKEKLYYDLIEVYKNTNKKEAKRIQILVKNEFQKKEINEKEEKHILKEIIKIDLNEENLFLLEKYSKKSIELYILFAELLNNMKNDYLIEKLLDVDLLLLELRKSTEKSNRRNFDLFSKLNKLQTIVIFMFKKIINDKKSNNNNIIILLDFLQMGIIEDKELFEIFKDEKDYILNLNVDKIKYLKYYQTHKNLNEEEEIELQNLMLEDFIDSNNYENINQIINLNERLKGISPIKEFKIRLKFYLKKESKELYKNKYIFELLKNKYYIILSNKDIVEKLIEEKSWSSGDFEKTTFIKDMIKYNKGIELWNVIQEIGNHFKIKMDSKLKTEFFFTKAEKLEDIF